MEYRLKDQVEGREKEQGERANVTRDQSFALVTNWVVTISRKREGRRR